MESKTIFDAIRDFRDTAELSEYDYNRLDLILDKFEPRPTPESEE